MIRIYWRCRGAPTERPGGPWWVDDFTSEESLERWVEDCYSPTIFEEVLRCKVEFGTPTGYPMNIYPPENARPLEVVQKENKAGYVLRGYVLRRPQ